MQGQKQHVLETLYREYEILCQIDLSTDMYVCDYRKQQESAGVTADFAEQGKFSKALEIYVQSRVRPDDRKLFDILISSKKLSQQLRTNGNVRVRYRGIDGNSRKIYEMQVTAEANGKNSEDICSLPAVMTIRCVDIFIDDDENSLKEQLQQYEKMEHRKETVLYRALRTVVWTAFFDQAKKLIKVDVDES